MNIRALAIVAAVACIAHTSAIAQGYDPHNVAPARKGDNRSNAPVPSLVRRGPDGRIVPLKQPFTWAAVRENPTITPEDWKTLEPVMRARRDECESIVLRNLDIVENVEAGAIDTLEGDVRQRIATARELLQPLRPEGGDFCVKLGKDRVLDDTQTRVSRAMVSRYLTAVNAQIRADLIAAGISGPDLGKEILHRQQLQPVDETLGAHRMLVDEASRNLERALERVHWSAETLDSIKPERDALAAALRDEERDAIMKRLMGKLAVSQRRELLAATVACREQGK